ncbi:MAG: hypothetical protein QS99_C0011G0036 [archaeon GW2011_AR4]|nr:MAG: hypothetical protein QS99_C0011G0036 [archaeon GW2011_AR4]
MRKAIACGIVFILICSSIALAAGTPAFPRPVSAPPPSPVAAIPDVPQTIATIPYDPTGGAFGYPLPGIPGPAVAPRIDLIDQGLVDYGPLFTATERFAIENGDVQVFDQLFVTKVDGVSSYPLSGTVQSIEGQGVFQVNLQDSRTSVLAGLQVVDRSKDFSGGQQTSYNLLLSQIKPYPTQLKILKNGPELRSIYLSGWTPQGQESNLLDNFASPIAALEQSLAGTKIFTIRVIDNTPALFNMVTNPAYQSIIPAGVAGDMVKYRIEQRRLNLEGNDRLVDVILTSGQGSGIVDIYGAINPGQAQLDILRVVITNGIPTQYQVITVSRQGESWVISSPRAPTVDLRLRLVRPLLIAEDFYIENTENKKWVYIKPEGIPITAATTQQPVAGGTTNMITLDLPATGQSRVAYGNFNPDGTDMKTFHINTGTVGVQDGMIPDIQLSYKVSDGTGLIALGALPPQFVEISQLVQQGGAVALAFSEVGQAKYLGVQLQLGETAKFYVLQLKLEPATQGTSRISFQFINALPQSTPAETYTDFCKAAAGSLSGTFWACIMSNIVCKFDTGASFVEVAGQAGSECVSCVPDKLNTWLPERFAPNGVCNKRPVAVPSSPAGAANTASSSPASGSAGGGSGGASGGTGGTPASGGAPTATSAPAAATPPVVGGGASGTQRANPWVNTNCRVLRKLSITSHDPERYVVRFASPTGVRQNIRWRYKGEADVDWRVVSATGDPEITIDSSKIRIEIKDTDFTPQVVERDTTQCADFHTIQSNSPAASEANNNPWQAATCRRRSVDADYVYDITTRDKSIVVSGSVQVIPFRGSTAGTVQSRTSSEISTPDGQTAYQTFIRISQSTTTGQNPVTKVRVVDARFSQPNADIQLSSCGGASSPAIQPVPHSTVFPITFNALTCAVNINGFGSSTFPNKYAKLRLNRIGCWTASSGLKAAVKMTSQSGTTRSFAYAIYDNTGQKIKENVATITPNGGNAEIYVGKSSRFHYKIGVGRNQPSDRSVNVRVYT